MFYTIKINTHILYRKKIQFINDNIYCVHTYTVYTVSGYIRINLMGLEIYNRLFVLMKKLIIHLDMFNRLFELKRIFYEYCRIFPNCFNPFETICVHSYLFL